jgi:hypothetical protein
MAMDWRGWATMGGFALVMACGGAEGDDRGTAPGSGPGITVAGDDDGGSGIDPGDGGGDKLDLGVGGTGGEDAAGDAGNDEGCKKVDLLFVIDNSGSMADEQANLAASVPGFIDAMAAELEGTEGYNVGVTTSDLYAANLLDLACFQEGALVTTTSGAASSNATCTPYSSGLRFMTNEDDLIAKFGCAARVGTEGDGNERPMQTMGAALSPGMTGPGGCNEGFIREDAILVVVIITDEEDDHEVENCGGTVPAGSGSAGEPLAWFNSLVAAKGGNEKAVVVLSLVGPADGSCPALDKCTGGIDGAEIAHRIIEMTEMFTYGSVGPVCQPYGPFFQSAISHIKSACDDFVPQG